MQRLRLLVFHLLILAFAGASCSKEKGFSYPSPTPQVIETPSHVISRTNELADNPVTKEGAALGRTLFFDPALSKDGKLSCSSCHDPKNGFSDPNQFSTGVFGRKGKRQSMGLANLRYETHFFWDGRSSTLEDQASKPIQDPLEMGMTPMEVEEALEKDPKYPALFGKAFQSEAITFDKATKAIAQYVRTLTSFNSRYDKMLQGTYSPTQEELEGMKLFVTHPDPLSGKRGANCGDCHFLPLSGGSPFEFDGFRNNGTSSNAEDDPGLMGVTGKASDFGKFKVPSLRNIALTAPYMHDGRFQTLEEVIDHYNNPQLAFRPHVDELIVLGTNERFGTSLDLTEDEKRKLMAFLHMLTDSTLANK